MKKCLCNYLASSLSLGKNEGADIGRNMFGLWCSFASFLRELFQVPAGIIAFSGS